MIQAVTECCLKENGKGRFQRENAKVKDLFFMQRDGKKKITLVTHSRCSLQISRPYFTDSLRIQVLSSRNFLHPRD
jgi:hypothetical protein